MTTKQRMMILKMGCHYKAAKQVLIEEIVKLSWEDIAELDAAAREACTYLTFGDFLGTARMIKEAIEESRLLQ